MKLSPQLTPLYYFLNKWFKIKAKYKARIAFKNQEKPPVLIYQMGKVGSVTVYETLKRSSLKSPILHLHAISSDIENHLSWHKKMGYKVLPYHLFLGKAFYDNLVNNKDFPIKIITLIRDPIAKLISGLFQNPVFHAESLDNADNIIDPEKIILYINELLSKPNTFNFINNWFDKELKANFDIDVFDSPFEKESGYTFYKKNKTDVLLIRLEDLTEKGPYVIKDFLGLPDQVKMKSMNVRNKTKDASVYQKILDEISIDHTLCNEIYSNSFVRHFYTDEMIDQFISKWSKKNLLWK